jgi:hypothetical protein
MLCLIVRQAYEPVFDYSGEAAIIKNWFLVNFTTERSMNIFKIWGHKFGSHSARERVTTPSEPLR